jgi:hypothetical protein
VQLQNKHIFIGIRDAETTISQRIKIWLSQLTVHSQNQPRLAAFSPPLTN